MGWKEGFPQLPLDKENKLNEESWKNLGEKSFWVLCFFFGKRKIRVCE